MGQGDIQKKDTMPLPSTIRPLRQWTPRNWDFPESHDGKQERLGPWSQSESWSPRKKFCIVLTSKKTAQKQGAEAVMSHWEQNHTLTCTPWLCILLAFCVNLSLLSEPSIWTWDHWSPLFLGLSC